jgi:general secretion pathway protein F/type IV pilus assembly protein PilC
MIFSYKGYDKKGKDLKSQINANSIEEAKEILKSQGILVESIKEKKSFYTPKLKDAELALFCRNISIYLKSSIPLYKAIALLQNSYEGNKRTLLWLQTLNSDLKSGMSFYEALQNQNIYKLPPYFLYSINMAEKSSNLTNTLLDLSDFISGIERLRKEVTKAFVYPSFIMLIAVVLVNFMLTSIVPNIVSIFESMGNELPASTKFTLSVSNFFQEWGFVLFGSIAALFALVGFIFSRQGKFRLLVDTISLKIPLIKTILLNFELGRFCRVSSLLLKSGVPFAQTMHFSSKVFSNTALKEAFEDISQRVIEGKPFFEAVKSQSKVKIPADFLSAVAIGEDSSELPFTLETLSEFYETNNQDKISILLSLLEPILMVFIGGIIGFLVVSMLLPIFSISI